MTISQLTKVECIQEHVHGDYDKAIILVNGERLTPEASLAVRNHSPGGFSWGYEGSGPAQLALAILLESGIEPDEAQRVHQDFKREFIAPLPQDQGWAFEVDVQRWVALKLARDES
jgi:hypothetical protein